MRKLILFFILSASLTACVAEYPAERYGDRHYNGQTFDREHGRADWYSHRYDHDRDNDGYRDDYHRDRYYR